MKIRRYNTKPPKRFDGNIFRKWTLPCESTQIPNIKDTIITTTCKQVWCLLVPSNYIYVSAASLDAYSMLLLVTCIPNFDSLICRAGSKNVTFCRWPLKIFYRRCMSSKWHHIGFVAWLCLAGQVYIASNVSGQKSDQESWLAKGEKNYQNSNVKAILYLPVSRTDQSIAKPSLPTWLSTVNNGRWNFDGCVPGVSRLFM